MTAGLSSEQACLEAYRAYLVRVYRDEFGVTDRAQAYAVAEDWFTPDERHDVHFDEIHRRLPGAPRILDMASGMGSTVLRGLSLGLDIHGLEPGAEKTALLRRRIDAGNFPAAWKSRFTRGVGERLPYKAGSFDCVLSYQTLEHVQDLDAVLRELIRVVKTGGALHLRCPDYRGTFEGHYLLPWIPWMPRPLARLYLRALGRPTRGFEDIHYVSRPGITRSLEAAARALPDIRLEILDLETLRYRDRLRAKGLPGWRGPSLFWKAVFYGRRLFRTELQMNLWVNVHPAPSGP